MYKRQVTGYSNFAKFKTDAAELLAARGDRKYSLWYCDIRNFKFINDIYGYDIGDELLSYWAELIAEGARPGETFGRISGDNFALLRCYRDIDDLVARFLRCSDLLTRFEGLANRRFLSLIHIYSRSAILGKRFEGGVLRQEGQFHGPDVYKRQNRRCSKLPYRALAGNRKSA